MQGQAGSNSANRPTGGIARTCWITSALRAALATLLLSFLAGPLAAQTQSASALDLESFEKVWTTVRNTHWDPMPGGLDWDAIYREYRPRAEQATTRQEARGVMEEMLARLGQTHFAIVPVATYSALASGNGGPAETGIDLRILDVEGEDVEGEPAAVVTGVVPDSPADRGHVRPGWIIERVQGIQFTELIRRARQDPGLRDLQITHALLDYLRGPSGGSLRVEFRDGLDKQVDLDLDLAEGRGDLSVFGNLPPMRVWTESRRIEKAGAPPVTYFRFNAFLDLPRVMRAFQDTIGQATACKECAGLIVDLRGNPGGIGAMAMGMAGFLATKPNQRLGTMFMRGAELKFVINPRPNAYTGPVAILIDENSASTAEIFAGGLQDLGRARVFGTPSAAAALPSLFETLPNGDGFQYAVANYISTGGLPLEANGVQPDVEVRLTRGALLRDIDPVIDAAVAWLAGVPATGR